MTESKRKTLHIGEIIRVEIEKVAHGGHFIARHEGAVIFIRHAIPGEIVEIEITGLEKSFARAEVKAVIEPSIFRVEAPCKYSLRCGGCDFQHVSVEHQRALKSDVISEQFARIAKMELVVEVEEVSSPLQWRSRFAASSNNQGVLGFKAQRSNEVIPIASCPILLEEIDFPTLPLEEIGAKKRVEVAISTSGERSISLMDAREDRGDARSKPTYLEGSTPLHYEVMTSVGELKYQVSPSSFWQSNIHAPSTLVEAVIGFADLKEGDHLVDLYGGVGLFAGAALNLIGSTGRIDIIEGSASATQDAAANFKGQENVFIHTGDVEKLSGRLAAADVIILDPPRTGAGKDVIATLATLGARSIIYVACDPAALARDTTYLQEVGYQLDSLRAFDLFPMTHHIESVAYYTAIKVS